MADNQIITMLTVYKKPCKECLFSDNAIVDPKRKLEVLESCFKKDTWFICHKSSLEGGSTCCKGFFDRHRADVKDLRIASYFSLVEFVDLPREGEPDMGCPFDEPNTFNPNKPKRWKT